MSRGKKLEIEVNILSEEKYDEKIPKTKVPADLNFLKGKNYKISSEKRGLHHVLKIKFLSPNISESHLELLLKSLKSKLSCGGNVSGQEIILQYKDQVKITETINNLLKIDS